MNAPHSNIALKHDDSPSREQLIQKFIQQSGFAEHTLEQRPSDASRRSYVRVVTPKTSYMVMDAPPEYEPVDAYLAIGNFLQRAGYSAPRIIAHDIEQGFILMEDLGNELFTTMLENEEIITPETEPLLYSEAVDLLAEWHTSPTMLKGSSALELPSYSLGEYMRELALFTDWFLPEISPEHHRKLADEFLNIWRGILLQAPLADCYFVHRDFHASNLMWLPNRTNLARVGLLDFQDAMWGDPSYDLVSLLEDARRDVDSTLAAAMQQRYIELTGQPAKLFYQRYAITGAQRNLKIIGIFNRLNKRDHKPIYMSYLPRVWKYLENDLAHPALFQLKKWFDLNIPLEYRQ